MYVCVYVLYTLTFANRSSSLSDLYQSIFLLQQYSLMYGAEALYQCVFGVCVFLQCVCRNMQLNTHRHTHVVTLRAYCLVTYVENHPQGENNSRKGVDSNSLQVGNFLWVHKSLLT